ncbi:tyrosine-type recombinase/integrase [Bordetella sp. 2513F-2]
MASIQQVAGGWRVQVKVRVPGHDKPLRDSQVFPTKRDAKIWGATREAELRAHGAVEAPKDAPTLRRGLRRYAEEVAPKHKGEKWEVVRLTAFENHPALPVDMPMGQVEPRHIAAFRDARLKVITSGSVRREMSLLSSVFTVAQKEWGWVKANPCGEVKRPKQGKPRERVIQWWELRALLRQMKYRPRAPHVGSTAESVAVCLLLAIRTGMRASELCGLTWDRVYSDYVHLPDTKNGTVRDVPLSSRARRLVARLRGWDEPSVFGLDAASLDVLFRRHRERAGLVGFTFHDSRHTAATMMASKVDPLTLCKIFGWTNPKQAMVYYNPTASSIAARLG